MVRAKFDARASTPESDEGSTVELTDHEDKSIVNSVPTSTPSLVFNELSEQSSRREKAEIPKHLENLVCFHCGFLRSTKPSDRGSGALDPTVGKWFCYLCWRQFRRDMFAVSTPNCDSCECDSC